MTIAELVTDESLFLTMTCLQCGEPLTSYQRHHHPAGKVRKFCTLKCCKLFRRAKSLEWWDDVLSRAEPINLKAKQIIDIVSTAHMIGAREIVGPCRFDHIVRARAHVLMMLFRHRPDLSTLQIGKIMNRDHSTVLYHRQVWGKTKQQIPTSILDRVDRQLEALR